MQFNTLEVPLDCWQCTLEPASQYRSPCGDSLIFMRDTDEKAQLEEDRKNFDRYFRPSWDLRTIAGGQALCEVQAFVSNALNLVHWNLPTDNGSIERMLRQAVKDGRLVPVVHRDRRSALGRVHRPAPAPLRWPSSSGGGGVVSTSGKTFHQMAMDSMALDAAGATAYIGNDNAMVQRVDDMAAARVAAKAGGSNLLGIAARAVGAYIAADGDSRAPTDDGDRDGSTPLGYAQAFEYSENMPNGNSFDIAKTPNNGEPGTWYTNPGSSQMRLFGDDGNPVVDLDFDHFHNGLKPHAHNWSGGVRDGGDDVVPFSPWGR